MPWKTESESALLCSIQLLLLPIVGANSFEFSVPDRSVSLALRSSLRFYASEETKPRTGKPREVTS
ncbi:hypothetical protein SLEP1_g42731 [Rubroshorea leprosula]|uniref:Secreted protein n=1 Tax=Rubroshorea leprosula TaxID=152421 RepID=A0AAV5LAV3_9ROSI|nr:hypothetical protein SLEP1_g42731 [Rubroshorea leprosula]